MLGKFSYKQNRVAGGHDIYYQGPFDADRRLLCTTVKTADGKWEVPLPNGALGPFKDRWRTGYAFLEHLLVEPAKALDMKVRCQWADLDLRRRDSYVLDAEFAGKIYDILVAKCRAVEPDRYSFVHAHTERPYATEWRFCGMLGFGGKFRNHHERLYVNCYLEDEGPERLMIMAETNEAIFDLWQKHYGTPQ